MATILVVDDDPDMRDVITEFLRDEGFVVSACDRADAALARLALALPDLLILDGRLPGMSGWQLLELLRASDATTLLPVLLLTAAIDDVRRAEHAPADACITYFVKPFDLDALLAAIDRVIAACTQQLLTC